MGPVPSDITLKVNIDPTSLLAKFRQIEEACKKAAQGVAGEAEKASRLVQDASKQMITGSTRDARQFESQLRSLEKQTQLMGKTQLEVNEIQRKGALDRSRNLKLLEDQEKRINAIYDQRRKYFQEEERRQQRGAGTGSLLFRGARDIFEGRMSYGVMDIGRAAYGAMGGGGGGGVLGGLGAGAGLSAISGTTLAIGGLTAGLGAFAIAGYKATESMAEYGHKIREMQTITGASVEDVQKLQVAATMSGRTMEDIAHGMRGFSQALEGGGATAVKAAKDFEEMGVDVLGLRLGTTSLVTVFEQMGGALRKNPDAFKGNIEMMDLLKKSGLNLKEVMLMTKQAAEESSRIHIFDEKQVAEMDEAYINLKKIGIEVGNLWDQLKLLTAEEFNADVNLIVNVVKKGEQFLPAPDDLDKSIANWFRPNGIDRWVGRALGIGDEQAPTPSPMGPAASLSRNAELMGQFDQLLARQGTEGGIEGAQQKLEDLKKSRSAMLESTVANQALFVSDPDAYTAKLKKVTQEIAAQKDLLESMKNLDSFRLSNAETLARLQEEVHDRQHVDELAAEAQERKQREAFAVQAERLGIPLGPRRDAYVTGHMAPLMPLYQQLQGQERGARTAKFAESELEQRQAFEREMGRIQLGGVQPVKIRELGQGGVTSADVERDINKQYEERIDDAQKLYDTEKRLIQERAAAAVTLEQKHQVALATTENINKLQEAGAQAAIDRQKELDALKEKSRDLERQHIETMSKIQLKDQEDAIKHDSDLQRRRADLRFKGDSPAEAIAEEYRIAEEEAGKLYQLEMQRIALHETGYKAEEDRAEALSKLHREDEQAQEDAAFKMAKMQQQQLDTLKGKIEPLYQTLFTNPSKFGQQLRQTVTEAALHPIVSGLSEMTATALHPLIYGQGGTGGIAGAFGHMFGGGRLNDVKLINGAVPVHVVGGGGGGTSIFSTGGYRRGGGTYMGGGGGTYGGGGGGTYIGGGGGIPGFTLPFNIPSLGPGGTAGFAPGVPFYGAEPNLMYGGGGGWDGAAAAPFGGGGGGGGTSRVLSPIAQMARSLGTTLTGLKAAIGIGTAQSTTWGESPGGESMARAAAGPGGPSGFNFSLKGLGNSQLARAGAGAAGSMLAQAGLLGNARGTAAGVFEGMAGGAGVGFSMGGPIGAAVGAAVGLGIGLGEVIAGVESPLNQVKRLARSIYHISVNNTTANQIVAMSNQSYGGNIAVTMRSPQVRQMLGLYAAGTGQGSNFVQGLDQPHGASLVESGGGLYQQATYQYGLAYTQRSSLPVFGGNSSSVIGPPGAPGIGIPSTYQLSLNIGGQDAAKFMTGQVVSPDVVQTQYAAAMNNSSGRVPQALLMSAPGSIAG